MPQNNTPEQLRKLIEAQKRVQAASKNVKTVLAQERAAEQAQTSD